MAFPSTPTNGQIAVVGGIAYQYATTPNSWSRILSSANIITANTITVGTLTANTLNVNNSISATGNVTGNYILGNGSQLTGITGGGGTSIANGTSNITITSSGGNATVNIGGTANVAVFATTGEYVTGVVSASGNVTGGNLLTGGLISATGALTVTGSTFLANVSAGNIDAGTVYSGGNITTNGQISAAGNIITNGQISAVGNVTAASGLFTNIVNVASFTGAVVSVSGNVTANNGMFTTIVNTASHTGGLVSVTGNITANNGMFTTIVNTASHTGAVVSVSGNVTGNYFVGNGSLLTGISGGGGGGANIANGTSNITIASSGGNATVNIGGTANVAVFATTGEFVTGVISATGNITGGNVNTGGLISATGNVTGGNISTAGNLTFSSTAQRILGDFGNATIANRPMFQSSTANSNTILIVIPSGTGNLSSFSALNNSNTTNTSTIQIIAAAADSRLQAGQIGTGSYLPLTFYAGGSERARIDTNGNVGIGNTAPTTNLAVAGTAYVSGNITGGNVTAAGVLTVNSGAAATAIVNGASNAVGNIGSSSTYFNRLFAQATTALYADLAEVYKSDAEYTPGTVLVFGGDQEVTVSNSSHDARIAGVVSTNPAHVMNSGLVSEFTVEVGLIGRVPCQVIGPIAVGDRVVSSSQAGVAERLDMQHYQPGVIIGKAVESYNGTGVGTIEVVVGRL